MERKVSPQDANLIYDPSQLSQFNSQTKAPIFGRFTWTQNLHALYKPEISGDVQGILNTFGEERKRYERLKQMRFTLGETQETVTTIPKTKSLPAVPPLRRPPMLRLTDIIEEDDGERVKRGPKPSLVARVTSGLDKLDALILTSRSSDCDTVREQLAEFTRTPRRRKLFPTDSFQDRYEDLFADRELYSEKTADMDKAFVTKIQEIQRQLSPDFKGNSPQVIEEVTRKRLGSSQMRVGVT